jgi:hypothetical protein
MKKSFLLATVRGLANDADIDGDELLKLVAAAATAGSEGAAEDDDLNDDPNVSTGEMPEGAAAYLKDKLSEDEMGELSALFKPKAADAAGGEEGEGEEGEGADDEGDDDEGDGKRANDAALKRKRGLAMDAASIEKRVIGRMTAWTTACEAVAPHIGRVKLAMDAAPDGARGLYRKALNVHGVKHAGINSTAALAAMVDMLPRPTAGFASDAAHGSAPSPLDGILGDARLIHRS